MNILQQLSSALEKLVADTAPAVVGIDYPRGHGSGFVLAPDGYLLTNQHVVAGQRRPRVHLASGQELPGEVVGGDHATDLAVVRVQAGGLTSLPLAGIGEPEVGQLVVAIGNPFRFERSVSLGVVSALDRTLTTPDGNTIEGVIQTDAAVNPGNSGGPLINAWGRVVGITTAIVPYARGIGFAIPAQTAEWVAGLLIRHGRIDRRFLGIAAKAAHLTPELAGELGQPRAVRVLHIVPGSPAHVAGIEEGDLLLRAGKLRLHGVAELHRVLATTDEGEIEMDVWRRGHRLLVRARPSAREAA